MGNGSRISLQLVSSSHSCKTARDLKNDPDTIKCDIFNGKRRGANTKKERRENPSSISRRTWPLSMTRQLLIGIVCLFSSTSEGCLRSFARWMREGNLVEHEISILFGLSQFCNSKPVCLGYLMSSDSVITAESHLLSSHSAALCVGCLSDNSWKCMDGTKAFMWRKKTIRVLVTGKISQSVDTFRGRIIVSLWSWESSTLCWCG